MGPGTDMIIFSLSKYDDPISSVGFSYAKEFAKQGRVFFIEHPFTWKDVLTKGSTPAIRKRKAIWADESLYLKDPAIPDNIVYVVPPPMIPVNVLPSGILYEGLSKRNDAALVRLLDRLIINHQIREFVFFNVYNPFYLNHFPPGIRPACKVYLSLDDISQEKYTAKHGARREAKIIATWDLAFATGKALCRKLSMGHGPIHSLLKSTEVAKPILHLPNGVSFERFHKAYETPIDLPKELQPYSGTRMIGYTGSVEYRMDFDLVEKIAEYHHDKTLVLIGPLSTEARSMLPKRHNILMIEAKPLDALPTYLKHMDVMIIPFLCNTLTASIYPLKLNEYLAAGKPVVTTNFSEDLLEFSDVVQIADSHEAFLVMVNTALSLDNEAARSARVEKARQNSWTNRVSQFWTAVGDI